jgi:hypothetical protein
MPASEGEAVVGESPADVDHLSESRSPHGLRISEAIRFTGRRPEGDDLGFSSSPPVPNLIMSRDTEGDIIAA